MLVDGQLRDSSFQRKTGYAQQQDLHLDTATVREALEFSALLRQPPNFTRQEKLDYVSQVINLLNMEDYADAVVGVLGEGLNVEQRKRLTIGVELAARPKLLLFLDEPTSGLDSQTSWSICNLMEKLTRNGQAILCTIHQPSAILFQRFDRLLLLAAGGKPVYFGEIGHGSRTLIDYFVRNGAVDCPLDTNPAEYMLEVIGAAPGAFTDIDWPSVWRNSPEYKEVQNELVRLKGLAPSNAVSDEQDKSAYNEFAAPLSTQILIATKRVFQQFWRTPSYIYSKALLTIGSVSPPYIPHPSKLIQCETVPLHRVLVLQKQKYHSRNAEPDVWCFHLSLRDHPIDLPDHSRLCDPAGSVRGTGTAVQGVRLARVYAVEHCR